MQRCAAVMLMLPLACVAQWTIVDTAFTGQQVSTVQANQFSPTNIAGYPAVAYWVADDISGTPATWPAKFGGYTLTMIGSPTVTSAGLNGHNYANFNGSSQKATNLTISVSQQIEVAMVVSLVNMAASSQYYFDAGNGTTRIYANCSTTPYERINAGTSLSTTAQFPTNKFAVRNWVYNGASSGIYTNGTAWITGNAGSSAMGGFTLAGNYLSTVYGKISVAEIVIYSTNLTATARSNLFSYWTNRYNIAL